MPDAAQARTLPARSVPTERVALPPGTHVVTDLHLAPLGDDRTEVFVAWCDALDDVPALVCLGDLFDTWVGRKQAELEGSGAVLEAFRRLTARGTEVHFVPGNRDALLDDDFDARTGGRLYLEGFVADVGGDAPAAFVHGDGLCTLDRGYLRLRRLWRWAPFRALTRVAPLWLSRWIGGRLRVASETVKPRKLPEEKSIRPEAVRVLADATGAATVVCGHAHEVRDEVVDGVRWVVVGAWLWERDLLTVGPGGALELGASATIAGPTDGASPGSNDA